MTPPAPEPVPTSPTETTHKVRKIPVLWLTPQNVPGASLNTHQVAGTIQWVLESQVKKIDSSNMGGGGSAFNSLKNYGDRSVEKINAVTAEDH